MACLGSCSRLLAIACVHIQSVHVEQHAYVTSLLTSPVVFISLRSPYRGPQVLTPSALSCFLPAASSPASPHTQFQLPLPLLETLLAHICLSAFAAYHGLCHTHMIPCFSGLHSGSLSGESFPDHPILKWKPCLCPALFTALFF
jgi:hypothetical protein